jgi:hypothetical protein
LNFKTLTGCFTAATGFFIASSFFTSSFFGSSLGASTIWGWEEDEFETAFLKNKIES